MKGTDVFPSKWLKADDLGDHEPTVVIDRVVLEEISQTERKPVIYFKGKQKGMVCNKTNWNRIAYIHKSDDSDDWPGKAIALYVELVDMQGQMKPAIRVKAPKAAALAGNGKPRGKLEVTDHGTFKTSTMRPADPIEETTGYPTVDPADQEIPF